MRGPVSTWFPVRTHAAFLVVLLLAVVLRFATTIAYRPFLVGLSDSWGYLALALRFDVTTHFVLAPDRPLGYPLLLWLLELPFGLHTGIVLLLQHLAGLLTGTLVYVLLVRLGVRQWLCVAAAAIVLLDTYAIALEHQLLPEACFTLLLTAGAVLVAWRPRTAWPLVLGGLAIGLAAWLRLAALVTIPVWGVIVLGCYWRRPGVVCAALAAALVPLALYASVHAGATGRVGFADASGFFLYGRVAYIADCDRMNVAPAARPLCQPADERIDDPGVYIFNQELSPGRKMFPGWGGTPAAQREADQLVGGFAREAIRARPFAYAGLAARDFGRFFVPGIQPWSFEASLLLPADVNADPGPLGSSVLPGVQLDAKPPAAALNAFWHVLRTPRWLFGLLTLLAAGLLAAGTFGRRRLPAPVAHRSEMMLLLGMALATLVAASLTAQFGVRYVVGVAPLFAAGGAIAVNGLTDQWAARRRARALDA